MSLNIAIHGAAGRMGRAIIAAVHEADARLVAAFEHADSPALGADAATLAGRVEPSGVKVTAALEHGLQEADVVIDFSLPEPATRLLRACAERSLPVVVGTTGFGNEGREALQELSAKAPVVAAPNYSVGVNLLVHLAARAAKLLGEDFDLEVVEMHHHNKVDAPSGTALRLGEALAEARGLEATEAMVHGRSGQVGKRRRDEIGMMALRGGDVVGDHTVVLAGAGERLELTHRAHTREIFSRGAVRAATWVAGQKPGLYDMADVLGIPR